MPEILCDLRISQYKRTLVGSGLKEKTSLRRQLKTLIPPHISLVSDSVKEFTPKSSTVTTASGQVISYDFLVVATGLQCNWGAISGLPQALAHPASGVSSIYSYDTCDKVWRDIDAMRGGRAIFTQPAGIVKCAGGELASLSPFASFSDELSPFTAPQKIMWMAWDRFRTTDRGETVKVEFFNGMPTMFSVKKYSDALEALRTQRKVRAEFQHNLISVDSSRRIATFKRADGSTTEEEYSMLHVVPPMGPLEVVKNSPLADQAGWVEVDPGTLRHKNEDFGNVFALGDCSNLPTSKTAAAITAQAPILTENVFSVMNTGKVNEKAIYDGYTSCPVRVTSNVNTPSHLLSIFKKLLTGYGRLMLAEFKYGLEPKETFAKYLGDQSKPRR